MTLYILDSDHLSLYGRNHPALIDRLQANVLNLTTTAINVEEQLRGRRLSSSYGDKQDLLKGGKGERVRGKGVLMRRSIAV